METNYEAIEQAHSTTPREKVMDDLQTLAHDAEDLLKATAGDVSEKTKATRARLSAALDRAKTTCRNWQEQAVARTKEAAKKTDKVIRDHPYESIGLAFGVGLLIGVLVGRR